MVWTGVRAVSTYVLCGIYNLTRDLGSILGGEYRLIRINMADIEMFAMSDALRLAPVDVVTPFR